MLRLFTVIIYYQGKCWLSGRAGKQRRFEAQRHLVIMAENEAIARARAVAWFNQEVKSESAPISLSPGRFDADRTTLCLDTRRERDVFVFEEKTHDVVVL